MSYVDCLGREAWSVLGCDVVTERFHAASLALFEALLLRGFAGSRVSCVKVGVVFLNVFTGSLHVRFPPVPPASESWVKVGKVMGCGLVSTYSSDKSWLRVGALLVKVETVGSQRIPLHLLGGRHLSEVSSGLICARLARCFYLVVNRQMDLLWVLCAHFLIGSWRGKDGGATTCWRALII